MKWGLALFFIFFSCIANANEIRVAVTTSFNNSGLSDLLLPQIKSDLGLDVQLLIVGTGQALKLARAGDVDAILVHSKKAEEQIIADGYATHRREIMYNDFVVVGPSDNPAGINSEHTIYEAMALLHSKQHLFVSRGDDSGTHRKELSLWQLADLNPEAFNTRWYHAVGSGMGASLNLASAQNAYILADRASWLKFGNKGDLALLFSGDQALFNQYAFLPVAPEKHPHVKHQLAIKLENWLAGDKGQSLIGSYKIDGQILFTPNAK